MASSGNFMSFNPLVRRASSYTDNEFSHSNLRLKYKVGNGGTLNCGFKLGDGKFYFEIYIFKYVFFTVRVLKSNIFKL